MIIIKLMAVSAAQLLACRQAGNYFPITIPIISISGIFVRWMDGRRYGAVPNNKIASIFSVLTILLKPAILSSDTW